MRNHPSYLRCAPFLLLLGLVTQCGAASTASDNAGDSTYAGGWTGGNNGGSGFGAWTLTGAGPSWGFFMGSSINNAAGTPPGIDTGGRSWGLYANSGALTAAYRAFGGSALAVGQTFRVSMDNGYIEGGNTVGFTLRTGNVTGGPADYNTGARFEFVYVGGDAVNSYKVLDADGQRDIGVPFTGTGLQLAFKLTSATSYTFRVTDNATSGTMVMTGRIVAATLDSFALYNRNAGPDTTHDAFFNSLAVSGRPDIAAVGSVDCGGGRVTSANYTMDGSVGGVGGISSADSPPETVKHGYIGQLTEVANLAVTVLPSSVNEGATAQLGAVAGLDDDTALALAGGELAWRPPAFPIGSISEDGVAAAANVYAATAGSVTGVYLGVVGWASLLVLDSNPDNFGLYASDGVPDGWQVQYFGQENPNAAATNDADHDGFDNGQEYVADTDPTNPASYFYVRAISNAPPNRLVCFVSSAARMYSLEYRGSVVTGDWSLVTGQINMPGSGGADWLTDTNAAPTRYYRVQVQVP
jgi:hypothetical protein